MEKKGEVAEWMCVCVCVGLTVCHNWRCSSGGPRQQPHQSSISFQIIALDRKWEMPAM